MIDLHILLCFAYNHGTFSCAISDRYQYIYIHTYIHTSDGSSFCILYYLYGHIKCLKAHDIPGMVTKYTFNTSDSF